MRHNVIVRDHAANTVRHLWTFIMIESAESVCVRMQRQHDATCIANGTDRRRTYDIETVE